MAKKCPYCGSANTVEDKGNNALLCSDCGQASQLRAPKPRERASSVAAKVGRDIQENPWEAMKIVRALIFAAIIGGIIYAYSGIQVVNSSLLAAVSIIFPNIAGVWPALSLITTILITYYVGYTVWKSNSTMVGFYYVAAITILAVGYPLAVDYAQAAGMGDYMQVFACTLRNVGSPEGMTSCQASVAAASAPKSEKIGDYDILDMSFDTEYTGSIIYRSAGVLNFDTYVLPLVIENPSDTETIKNLIIYGESSEIKRSGNIRKTEKIRLAKLETTDRECMDMETPCEIGPKEKLTLSLHVIPCITFDEDLACIANGCEWDSSEVKCVQIMDRETDQAEARVGISYDYEGEGKFDFIVAKSDDVLEALLDAREDPTSSDGPLDVKVYFAPSAYVFRDIGSGTKSETEVSVMIILEKDVEGTAYIKDPIRITRFIDGVLGRPEPNSVGVRTCSSPWGEDLVLEPDENSETIEYIKVGGSTESPKALTKSHIYVCKYVVKKDGVGEKGEQIPFTVVAHYIYRKSIFERNIQVVNIS